MTNTWKYPIILTPDSNDTFLVTFPDFEDAVTFGDTREEAVFQAENALREVIAARIAHKESIPTPSKQGDEFVALHPLTVAKVLLYKEMQRKGFRKSDLARILDCDQKQIDRIVNIKHNSTLGQLSAAFAAMGDRLVIGVEDAASWVENFEDTEMLDDIRAYDEAKAARNAGEEYFPAEFVYAKMEATTTGQLISLWMEYRHVTQTALAESAGISRPYLSEIMSDKKPGSLSALKAIAKVLRADLEDITGY